MDNNTPQLTDQEKQYLENYDEGNPFIQSLAENYKEKASLTEKQILALRKDRDKEKNRLNHCPTTNLTLKEECFFQDEAYKEDKKVVITAIRPKAICIADDVNQMYAWMPSSAIDLQKAVDSNTGDETSVITLKGWFTRDDDFWKQSKPFNPKPKEEHIIEDDVVITPKVEEKIKMENDLDDEGGRLDGSDEQPKSDWEEEVDELYKDNDELPF